MFLDNFHNPQTELKQQREKLEVGNELKLSGLPNDQHDVLGRQGLRATVH